jgi:hypothetical protein
LRSFGAIAACVLPFHGDLNLDRKSFLLDVAANKGLSAMTIKHSTDVMPCLPAEQQQVQFID